MTSQASIKRVDGEDDAKAYRITNIGESVIDTHLLVIVSGLPAGARVLNASGTTSGGDPYLRLFLQDGVLNPGAMRRCEIADCRQRRRFRLHPSAWAVRAKEVHKPQPVLGRRRERRGPFGGPLCIWPAKARAGFSTCRRDPSSAVPPVAHPPAGQS